MDKFKWINIFVRDLILSGIIVWMNYVLEYQSWFAAALAGMIIVQTSWHLNDLLKEKRGLSNGFHRLHGDDTSSVGDIHNSLQQN